MTAKSKYCSKCGIPLIEAGRTVYYNNDTGKELAWIYYKCPNKTFFSIGHDTGTRNSKDRQIEIDSPDYY